MKRLLGFFGTVSLFTSSATTVVSCEAFSGDSNTDDTTSENDLSKIILKLFIGQLTAVDETEIRTALQKANQELQLSSVSLTDITDTTATVSANGDGVYSGSVVISYVLVQNIQAITEVIQNENLGEITDNNETTIIQAIKNKNPDIDATFITLTAITETSALVNTVENSIYNGTIFVRFTLSTPSTGKNLQDVIKNTWLETLPNNFENTILGALYNKNTSLVITSVSVTNITQTTALISGNGDGFYIETVTVSFTIQEQVKTGIWEVMDEYYLGVIKDNTTERILATIAKYNTRLNLNYVTLSSITTTSAKITANSDGIYTGEAAFTFALDPTLEQELSTVITMTSLGGIDDNASSTILAKIQALNSAVDIRSLAVSNITSTSATISGTEDTRYVGTVNVTFAVITPLTRVITVTSLGEIEGNGTETILARIKSLNSSLDTTYVTISSITKTSAIVTASGTNTIYSGSVSVSFTIAKIDLSTVITMTALGEIKNNASAIILTRAKALNENLIRTSVTVTSITTTSASISANDGDENYKGSVNVTFTISEDATEDLDKVLVGYYYDWGGEAQVRPSFSDIVQTSYNVIDVSFLYASTANTMPVYQPIYPTEVKEGIALLHANDKKALISMGGQTGDEMRFTYDQKDQLKATILAVVDEYGFDGLDIDWEGSCLSDRVSQETTIDALKEIKDERPEFIITMAPEMPYIKNSTETSGGSYIPFLKGLDEYYDWINPQYYNGWAFGPFAEQAEAAKLGISEGTNISNDDVANRDKFYYLMTKYLTTTYSNRNDFYLIEPQRFSMGASTNEPAGRGAATENAIKNSYALLVEDGIYTKGLMTWAVNFDAYEGSITSNGQVIAWKKWTFASWYDETHGSE